MVDRRFDCRGFSLVELLFAASLTLLVTASVFGIVHPAHGAFRTEPEFADLQQRLRVGIDTLSRELLQAGAGPYQGQQLTTPLGPLVGSVPSVLPFRQGRRRPDPPGTFKSDTLTVLHVEARAAQTTIAQPLPARSATVRLNDDPGCPSGDPACGFRVGMTVLVLDDSGAYDVFGVAGVEGNTLSLQHQLRDAPYTYSSSVTRIVAATSRTYHLKADPASDTVQLVQYDGADGPDVPVVDHVVGLSFEYLGDPWPPLVRSPIALSTGPWTTYGPKPPPSGVRTTSYPAGENCVFVSDGSLTPAPRLAVLGDASPSLVRLDRSQLADGPWCPDADHPNRFDADLLRVRSVVVTLRVESAVSAFRGPAGPLFTRSGTSTGGHPFLPDQEVRFTIAPRNLNLGR